MNCKPLILSGCAIMLAQSLLFANFYWVGASNDWRNPASYSSVAGGEGGTHLYEGRILGVERNSQEDIPGEFRNQALCGTPRGLHEAGMHYARRGRS